MEPFDITGMRLRLPNGQEFGTVGKVTLDETDGFTASIHQLASGTSELHIEQPTFQRIAENATTPLEFTTILSELIGDFQAGRDVTDDVHLSTPPGPDVGPFGDPNVYPPGTEPPADPPR